MLKLIRILLSTVYVAGGFASDADIKEAFDQDDFKHEKVKICLEKVGIKNYQAAAFKFLKPLGYEHRFAVFSHIEFLCTDSISSQGRLLIMGVLTTISQCKLSYFVRLTNQFTKNMKCEKSLWRIIENLSWEEDQERETFCTQAYDFMTNINWVH